MSELERVADAAVSGHSMWRSRREGWDGEVQDWAGRTTLALIQLEQHWLSQSSRKEEGSGESN